MLRGARSADAGAPGDARCEDPCVNPPETAVARHLVWIFLQGAVFLPVGVGQSFWENVTAHGSIDVLGGILAVWIAFLIVRNLLRLWRAPASEARRTHCLPLFAVGVAFALLSSGPLMESARLSTKPLGGAWLLIASALLVIAGREVLRLRARPSTLAMSA